MSRFQLIFIAILIALGVGGAILFATAKNQKNDTAVQTVMWGTVKRDLVSNFISKVAVDNRSTLDVVYVEKSPVSFESELISALARGAGPDMVLLPQDLILKQLDKFYIIPFANYSERTFKDSFIEEGEMYLLPPTVESEGGIIGFPFSIDPLVMYWNRDMFSNEGIATPPTTWTELYPLVPKFTKKDSAGNITQSLVAFGETRNVTNAKDMIALLSIQAGTPIVARDTYGTFQSVFNKQTTGLPPGEEAVSFFTGFSDPVKVTYSWNRSLPNDKTAFIGARLALYFGYASELASIRNANPNLNFDVARMPQAIGKKATFGKMNAIAILRTSPNVSAAFTAATTLSSAPIQTEWATFSGLPPVRRDLLSNLPGDAYKSVFYQSALIGAAWFDPYREATDNIFVRLIDNVTSGKLRVSEAVKEASLEIDNLLRSNI